MNRQMINRRINILQDIKQLKANQRLDFLKNCSNECIHAICEVCYNILHESLKLNKDKKYRIKQKLKPIRVDVRKLADAELSVNTKRKILSKPQVGRGVFTVLASTVLPALISALLSK